jgi:hypothetical protein
MQIKERRRRRGDTTTQALKYQLAACCEDGRIEAMVLADGDGLPLASSGDTFACDEVAARMVRVGARIREWNGTLLGAGHAWNVQMLKVDVDGSELLVCAVGGTAEARKRQIARGAEGARRILAV